MSSSADNTQRSGLECKKSGACKSSVQIKEPPVTETRGYSIVKIEEKHGPLHRAIPVMPLPLAIVCCLLNLFLPGVGTLISSFSVFCCGSTRMAKRGHAFGLNMASALLQMVTFFVIVGWIWSILWGMTFVQLTREYFPDSPLTLVDL
ncbi:hypothetical protein CAPTEDRAFT_105621 [Capitella teleta]|uniref:Protein stum homolog n=1 Tax=Capitella teleta TaxID=283909 RepID=R7THT8_CAPTE|nr:hypothetical protein CAPTEDRAFT_105621 [Capitella teleta]|eukprot:ELT93042.1 hypothetical protein CAPTEDRAFT_105621 [Capitella teleta]